jgi:putative tricarboxylic transport membrane protein
MDLIVPCIVGIMLGVFSGVLPGIGTFVSLLLIFPYLIELQPIQILICYVAITSISQYVSSIPAIVIGIPGESSSMPAVLESKNLKTVQDIQQSIVGSAIGSTFGGLIVVIMCWLFLEYIMTMLLSFDTTIMFFIYVLLIFLLIIVYKSNSITMNIAMILLGLLLGLVGYTKSLYTEILTFGNKDLFGGFPLVVVAVALLGLPEIFKNFQSKIKFKTFESTRIKVKFSPIKNFIASVIGFVGGLAPGMTTILSSQLAYMYSTLMKYSPVDKITASETANNAGSFSQLLPLMMLGIPLLSSEALVINLMESKGYNLISTNFESLFYTVGVSLIFINIIGLLIAWPGARYVIQILKIDTKKLYLILVLLLFGIVLYVGYQKYQLFFYAWSFLLLGTIGWMMRNYNTMPLVFAFMIHDKIFDVTLRFISLHF